MSSKRGLIFFSASFAVLCVFAVYLVRCSRGQDTPPPVPLIPPPPQFTETERQEVQAYWAAPSRYSVVPAPGVAERVNLSVAGSLWQWQCAAAFATRRREIAPGDKAALAEVAACEAWMNRRIAWHKAQIAPPNKGKMPPDPGAVPALLQQSSLGQVPPLFERVQPLRYTVTFAQEDASAPMVYTDNLPRPDRYAYYRATTGVMRVGKQIKTLLEDPAEKKRIEALFAACGRTDSERRVLQAVSALEGGFEAVNTYDTGFISVGFIQFIAGRNGDASLAAVLRRHKTDDPADFENTFRRFGLDVAPTEYGGCIVALDPVTGEEKRASDAVSLIIADKRLTAVFERAGRQSEAFRRAQVLIARERYWPGDDVITVPVAAKALPAVQAPPPPMLSPAPQPDTPIASLPVLPGTLTAETGPGDTATDGLSGDALTIPVQSVIRSEAGLATLMDRKVNRGNIRLLNDIAQTLMREKKLTRLEDLSRYEREIIRRVRLRADFLSDRTLSQPK